MIIIIINNKEVCWPRDWLPERFPGSRIISISYDVFMSKWIGQSLPIKDQAVETLQKLLLAKVGDRPVIFVTHSFGGLLLKQLLKVYISPSFLLFIISSSPLLFFSYIK